MIPAILIHVLATTLVTQTLVIYVMPVVMGRGVPAISPATRTSAIRVTPVAMDTQRVAPVTMLVMVMIVKEAALAIKLVMRVDLHVAVMIPVI